MELLAGGAEAVASFGRQMIAEHGLEDNFYAYDLSRLCLLHQVGTLPPTITITLTTCALQNPHTFKLVDAHLRAHSHRLLW